MQTPPPHPITLDPQSASSSAGSGLSLPPRPRLTLNHPTPFDEYRSHSPRRDGCQAATSRPALREARAVRSDPARDRHANQDRTQHEESLLNPSGCGAAPVVTRKEVILSG